MTWVDRRQLHDRSFIWTAAFIVAVALLLRWYRIGAQELWLDEVYTFHLVTLPSVVKGSLLGETPPLYYVLLKLWTELFGTSEAGLRGLSAVFGASFVAAIIWAGREILTPEAGLWAGLFSAVAPMHIYYSQEARAYALLTLVLALAYACLWRAHKENRVGWWLAASLSILAALYTHYLSVLALAPTAVLPWMWRDKGRWICYAKTLLLSFLLFFPWVAANFIAKSEKGNEAPLSWVQLAWQHESPLLSIPRTLEVFTLGSQKGLLVIWLKQFTTLEFPAGLRLLGVASVGLLLVWVAVPWRDQSLSFPLLRQRKAFLFLWLFAPLLALWNLSFYKPLYAVGRYDLIAFPAYALVVGLAFSKLQANVRSGLAFSAFLLLLVPIGAKLYLYYNGESFSSVRERDRRAAQALHANVKEGDAVVFTSRRGLMVLYYTSFLGYRWKDHFCFQNASGRRFPCRQFYVPRWLARQFSQSPGEATREEIRDFLRPLSGEEKKIWVVFGADYDKLFIEEFERMGFKPLYVDDSIGIAMASRF